VADAVIKASNSMTLESNKSVHDLVIGLFINRYEFGRVI